MVRSGPSRAFDAGLLLLGAALPLVVLVTARSLPPADLASAGLDWLPAALAGALVVAASLLGLACLVAALRDGIWAALLGASAAGALGGGALSLSLSGTSSGLATAVPVGAALLLGAVIADGTGWTVAGRNGRMAAAAAGLMAAEAAVMVGIVPGLTAVVEPWRDALLVAAVVVSGAAALGARDGWLAVAGAGWSIGSAGLLLDRGSGLELLIGLLALAAAAVAGLRVVAARIGSDPEPVPVGPELPALAHHLTDAVMHFDGRLGLREWNAAAANLLGLDAHSRGTRLEDLLGISIAELPADEGATLVTTAVGGLAIGLHRSGEGLVAIVGERRGHSDEERLGRELRGTIEELLQARRTIDLQRAEIERSSTVDRLTGVASRGAILDRLRIEIAQARRYQHPIAVALLDVDGFAGINHRHGVSGGDALLREVALRMRLRVREADALGRAGSDGFLAILPHTDEGGAATFAAALRRRLAQRPVPVGDELLHLTVSIGVAVMLPGEELDLDGLMARVGEALDSARSAGGDRIALDREHGFLRLAPDDDRRDPDREREAT
jgi:diguanylate cyclase (GGDEF)-like protein